MQRVVRELAQAVGLADAIAIIRRWGGRDLYIPIEVNHGDALALTLGLDTARKLVAWCDTFTVGPAGVYRKREVQLPAERNVLLDLRNEAIVERIKGGASHEAVGLEFGLTRQMVSRIAKVARERGAFAGSAPTSAPRESGLRRAVPGGPPCPSASPP